MRLSLNTPVDAESYTQGQRGNGIRRTPGMIDSAYFADPFDSRLSIVSTGDTSHEQTVLYTWGLDSAEDASGGWGSGKGAPSMGDTGDVPDTDYDWHGYGIKGDETRQAQTERHPNVFDNNPNTVLGVDGVDYELITLPYERITEKPVPTPGRGPGDDGGVAMPASPQMLNPEYNALGVTKRFSEDYSHGDLGLPYAALPEWQEWAVPNAAPTPTSSGATEPNTRTRQSTFTTMRVPVGQWDSFDTGDYQANDRWGA